MTAALPLPEHSLWTGSGLNFLKNRSGDALGHVAISNPRRWTEQPGGLSGLLCRSGSTPFGRKASTAEQPDKASSDTRLGAPGQLSAAHVLATLFTGNFIGIVCARTLHYQFYSW